MHEYINCLLLYASILSYGGREYYGHELEKHTSLKSLHYFHTIVVKFLL